MQIELFLKYLSSVKRYSENTIIAYKADLYQFYEFCGSCWIQRMPHTLKSISMH